MKLKIVLAFALTIAFASISFAQTVTVTEKTVNYKRPKPQSEFKKTFTITYPKISGVSPVLAKKIEKTISYEEVLNLNLKDELGELQWLEETGYEVSYNKNGILSIYLWMTGTAAYPSNFGKNVVVDLKTGNKILANEVFTDLDSLVAKVKAKQQTEVQDAIKEIKSNKDYEEDNPESLFESVDYTTENLQEFSIGEQGVTFNYNYGFPHVIQALQPEGKYLMTWSEIKPFIKRDGLLANLIR